MATPGPILTIFFLYIVTVRQGPKLMESQKPVDISKILVVYNMGLVVLSAYMCYEVSLKIFLHVTLKWPSRIAADDTFIFFTFIFRRK